jgi:hypothetical protein
MELDKPVRSPASRLLEPVAASRDTATTPSSASTAGVEAGHVGPLWCHLCARESQIRQSQWRSSVGGLDGPERERRCRKARPTLRLRPRKTESSSTMAFCTNDDSENST